MTPERNYKPEQDSYSIRIELDYINDPSTERPAFLQATNNQLPYIVYIGLKDFLEIFFSENNYNFSKKNLLEYFDFLEKELTQSQKQKHFFLDLEEKIKKIRLENELNIEKFENEYLIDSMEDLKSIIINSLSLYESIKISKLKIFYYNFLKIFLTYRNEKFEIPNRSDIYDLEMMLNSILDQIKELPKPKIEFPIKLPKPVGNESIRAPYLVREAPRRPEEIIEENRFCVFCRNSLLFIGNQWNKIICVILIFYSFYSLF